MGSPEEKYNRRRLRTSFITTVVSIALVLFMLGTLGVLLYHAHKISEHVKENIGFTVILKDGIQDAAVQRLTNLFEEAEYVKESRFVTKEEAAKDLMEELGEDFVGFLGYNPLLPSFELKLKASYANNDSIALIEKDILANNEVNEVFYQRSLVNLVNENLRKVSLVILAFSIILLAIAIALINNTIRLAVYAKRFLIKTMQLVGATEGFIRKPFLITGIVSGIYGALLALLLIASTLFLAKRQLPELINLQDIRMYFILFGMVTALGIVISWVSTFIAVRKYLRLKADYLY